MRLGPKPRPTPYTRPLSRTMLVDGVPLTVTLTDRAISAKLKGARKRQASVALFGLFQNLLREWRKDHPAPLPQEALPLEEGRP